jgi:hypothetical protein
VDSNLKLNSNLNQIENRVELNRKPLYPFSWAANLTFSPCPLSSHARPTSEQPTRRPSHPRREALPCGTHLSGRHVAPFFLHLFPFPLSSLSAPTRCRGKQTVRPWSPALDGVQASRSLSSCPLYLPRPIRSVVGARGQP